MAKKKVSKNKRLFDIMMGAEMKMVPVKPISMKELVKKENFEKSVEKLSRLIAPVPWEEYDLAPKGREPGTKSVSNAAIWGINSANDGAIRILRYFAEGIQPEVGQNESMD